MTLQEIEERKKELAGKIQDTTSLEELEERAKALLSLMTLEEKVAQMDIIRGVEFSTKPHKLYHCAVHTDSEISEEKLKEAEKKYIEQEENKQPSMSFTQDEGYIKASFMSDYHIDLDKDNLHWWEFYDDLVGLTDNCILNRVRRVREEPLKGKKGEELHRWQEAKKAVALKVEKTKREKELDEYWEHLLNQKGE